MNRFLTDTELLRSLHDGDRGAYFEVFERFIAQLNFFAISITGDRQAAEDIASESFSKVFNQKREFATISDFKSFLFRVTSNEALNYVKKEQRYRSHLGRWKNGQTLETDDIHVRLVEAEAVNAFFKYLNELPEQIREVVRLSLFEGLTLDEIAEKMDIAYKSVRNYKSKGIAMLREKLTTNTDISPVLLVLALNILQAQS